MIPNLSVIIPWCDRPEIAETLTANLPIFRSYAMAVTIVNCGGDSTELEKIVLEAGADALLLHLTDVPFNLSLARNLGLEYSCSEYVFMLDADVVVSDKTVRECLTCVDNEHVLAIAHMRETISPSRPLGNLFGVEISLPFQGLRDVLFINEVELQWDNEQTTTVQFHRSYSSDGGRSGLGQIIVERANLLKVDGYNSEFKGWGFEDVDVLIRLQYALGLKTRWVGEVMHLSHSDTKRALKNTTRQMNHSANLNLALANYARGNFLGSFSQDLAKHRDRVQLRQVHYCPP